jgi:hypothetical protein
LLISHLLGHENHFPCSCHAPDTSAEIAGSGLSVI